MDDKDAPRTIMMGFTDRFVASDPLRVVMETFYLTDESMYKGHLAWLLLIHILYFVDTSIKQLYNQYWRYLRIYFAGIFSQNY